MDVDNHGFYTLTIDGVVHIYDQKNKMVAEQKVTNSMANCMSILESDYLLVGQQNCELGVYRVNQKNNGLVEIGSDDSYEGAVVSVDKHPLVKDMLVTGDSLGNLTFYKVNDQYMQNKEAIKKPNNKKIKVANKKQLEYLTRQKVSNQ